MQRVLFHDTIFGPIHSRRLGASLGVNLSPLDGKVCTFDCLYCEAGFNAQGVGTTGLPPRAEVARLLEEKLRSLQADGSPLDVITFSGNGEPTVHPEFAEIIDDTLRLRDRYFPQVKVSVLTNSTRIDRPNVVAALRRVDNNILKLDSAITDTMRRLDRPTSPDFTSERVIELLRQFAGEGIIQTMIVKGSGVDNTTDAEIDALIEAYRVISPREVMIYSIDRQTPDHNLQHISRQELEQIAQRITDATGLPVQVSA
jgi:wyosine [tRNA(Phe)-imidazoG37] synthetase (radical SAM superfamily)